MKEESFIMVSLKEENAKKLAQVISNNTCRKILEYLAKKKATETELSEKLGVPLSTVHYNIQQLVSNKLAEADEFHYSKKGKEIIHYSLANKYIIIAPKEDSGFLQKLKEIMPAALVGIISTTGLYIYSVLSGTTSLGNIEENSIEGSRPLVQTVTEESAGAASDVAIGIAKATEGPVGSGIIQETTKQASSINGEMALWFFLGVVVTVTAYLITIRIRKKLKKQ